MRIDRPSQPHDFSPVGKIPSFNAEQMKSFLTSCQHYFNNKDYLNADHALIIVNQDIETGKNNWFDTNTYNAFKDASQQLSAAIAYGTYPPVDPNPTKFNAYFNQLLGLIDNNS